MDDLVKAAMRKWPNVPDCHGWLALDARGGWYMRDDRTQAAGPFPQVKGSRIAHDKLLDFIGRNYARSDDGAWFFQNGPQRVFVELEAAPYVWRLFASEGGGATPTVQAHTGAPAGNVRGSWLDEGGRLFLETDLGYGLVHSLDTGIAAGAIDAGVWQPQTLAFDAMPGRFGYLKNPAAEAGLAASPAAADDPAQPPQARTTAAAPANGRGQAGAADAASTG